MADRAARHRIHGYCALCVARCGSVALVEDGRFTRLEPDPAHPTGQALCAKGRAAPELVYHPERLTHPLRRTRPKGDPDPGWVRIGWDEALEEIARAMRRIAERDGPQAVCFSMSSPSSSGISDSVPYIRRLMNAFGSPNVVSSFDVCGWGRMGATRYTFGAAGSGTSAGGTMPDIANSGCLILWGYNPSFSRLTHATATVEALKRGMRLIVIDPRHVGLASKADLWLRVRPGTDGALALGIAHLMIERGWYDQDFIRSWSNGPMLVRADTGRLLTERDLDVDGSADRFVGWNSLAGEPAPYGDDCSGLALEGEYRIRTTKGEVICHPVFELYAQLCRQYPPERVEAICSVPRAEVEEAARLIGSSRPVSYYAWSGHEQHANVMQTARAISLLYALTGCFDAPGGNAVFPVAPAASIAGEDLPAAKNIAPTLGLAERPLGPARSANVTTREFYRAVLEGKPYPVRGLIGFGCNMLLSHADGGNVRTAPAALDFYAHSDLFMSPTAQFADVVLPAASCFEREALRIGFETSPEAQSWMQFRPAVAPPPGEARPDTDIVFALAARLGLGAQFWNGEIEASYRRQLAPTGVSLEALRASPSGLKAALKMRYAKFADLDADGEPRGFATPTRRVELYSQTFLDHGYAPLPEYTEPGMGPAARPDLAARFPLILTNAKSTLFCQSQHRALPSLRRRSRGPELDVHPAAAAARGIANGDWVSIETPEGSVMAQARYNESLHPDVVVGEHGWWQGCAAIGAPSYEPFAATGANLNLIIGGRVLDPISGTASHKSYLCEIRSAVAGRRASAERMRSLR
jgi:anaerobic selenocysteine-containing dehydrogenase